MSIIKYELTKSIGFKLNLIKGDWFKERVEQLENYSTDSKRREDVLLPLIEESRSFIILFKKFIFRENSNGVKKEDQKLALKVGKKIRE